MPASVSVLQLVKRKDEDNSDIDSVDLMSLPIELQYEGWQQATPQQQGQPSVDDVIALLMNAGDDNALAAALQSIDVKIKEIQWAQDPLNPIGVWLRSRLSTETNARQAFITAGRRSPALRVTDPLAYDSILQQYQLGLTRMPRWENVLKQTITSGAISIHGGTVAYSINGDAHARVALAKLSSAANPALTDAWFGVKSSRYGVTPANFVPVWNLDKGTAWTDTSSTADATALDGNKMVCTFGTVTTMDYRVTVPVSAITANKSDQRGKYIVLLRAKTTDSTLVTNVRIGQGALPPLLTPQSFAWKPRYRIATANSGWRYYTVGQIMIPASSGFTDNALLATGIGIQAEKISGSGNLEMDSLVLIPAEHSVHIQTAGQGYGLNSLTVYIYTRPDYRYSSIVIYDLGGTPTYDSEFPTPDVIDWSIPAGSGVIVCAGSNATTSAATTFTPTFYVYPSYSSLRGTS